MGTYSQRNDDFVILDIGHTHPFVGKKLQELALPEGLYAAVVLRGEDMLTHNSTQGGDRASVSRHRCSS